MYLIAQFVVVVPLVPWPQGTSTTMSEICNTYVQIPEYHLYKPLIDHLIHFQYNATCCHLTNHVMDSPYCDASGASTTIDDICY